MLKITLKARLRIKVVQLISAVFVFKKVKVRIEVIRSGPPIFLFCFVSCVCTVKMPDWRLETLDKIRNSGLELLATNSEKTVLVSRCEVFTTSEV